MCDHKDFIEYEFTKPCGAKVYEMVDKNERGQAFKFMKMHGAKSFKPVNMEDTKCQG